MSRPIGVTIIAVLQWIRGVLNVRGGAIILSVSPLRGFLAIILGLLTIGLGVGMWRLQIVGLAGHADRSISQCGPGSD